MKSTTPETRSSESVDGESVGDADARDLSMQLGEFFSQPSYRVELFLVVLIAGSLCFAYADTIFRLVDRWSSDPNYGHGFFVPLVSGFLIWREIKGSDFPGRFNKGYWVGVGLIVVGMLLRLATTVVPSLFAESLSLIAVLAGLFGLLAGRNVLYRAGWGLVFLVFMIPWPAAVYSRLAFPLQQLVCQLSAVTLDLLGVPVLRVGNLLHLPGETLHVAEACSGLRQLVAFLAVCSAAAILLARPAWIRLSIFFSAVPIAVFVNNLRVTLNSLLVYSGFGAWTEGTFHTLEGLLMVGLGLAILFAEMALFDWLIEPEKHSTPTESSDPQSILALPRMSA